MKIKINKETMYKLKVMSEQENEVASWLLGKIKGKEIIIDGIIIPKQEVGGASVEIGTEGVADTIKNHKSKLDKILGHYHSHNSMSAFWSGIDENNMDSLMRRKKFFIFIVMSYKEGKYEYKSKIRLNEPFMIEQDCELEVIDKEMNKIREKLNKEIEKKCTKKVYPEYTGGYTDYGYGRQTGMYDNRFMDKSKLLEEEKNDFTGIPHTLKLRWVETDEVDLITELMQRYDIKYYEIKQSSVMGLFEVTIDCPSKSRYKKIKQELQNEGIYENRNPLDSVKVSVGGMENGLDKSGENYPSSIIDL